MKKGLIVFANLALLLLVCVPAFSQPNSKGVETIVIDNFDGTSDDVDWEWNVQACRDVYEDKDSGTKYPIISTFEGIPNSLKYLRKDDGSTPKVLGVKTKFKRKGHNWFEVYPTKDGKPYEIEFVGNVAQIDLWVWGANYLYFLDILVRDADGRVHILNAGNLAFNGWRNVIVKVPGYLRQKSRIPLNATGLTFVGFRITSDPDEFVDNFMVYFDNFKYTTYALSNIFDGYELKESDFGDGEAEAKTESSSTQGGAE